MLFNVTRNDNGTATFTYDFDTSDTTAAITATGSWDDTTPWASDTYDLSFAVKSNTGKASFRVEDVSGRTGILIHDGNDNRWSEGCLIVDQTFIDSVYADLKARGVSTVAGNPVTSSFNVSGDYTVGLRISSNAATVVEGGAIQLTVSLTGPGAANGLSKDVYVKIGSSGTATEGLDFSSLSSLPESQAISNLGPGWIKIPKNQSSVTVEVPTTLDNVDAGTENPSETVHFTIIDYRIHNDFINSDKFYKDGAGILLPLPSPAATIEIQNKASVLNKVINASGGYEGYQNTEQFSPGQDISIRFDPYSIPDRMVLTDSSGATLLDTGFIGGRVFASTFKVPSTGDGLITIQVLTNNTGTAWNFTLATVGPAAPMAAVSMDASSLISLDAPQAQMTSGGAAAIAPFQLVQDGVTALEGDSLTVGPVFSLIPTDPAMLGKTITWSITGGSASAADFGPGAVLQGSIAISQGQELGKEAASIQLPTPIDDGIAEGLETFHVEFRDSATGSLFADASGVPLRLTYSIVDEFSLIPVTQGTTGPDTLQGSGQLAVINGLTGDDLITGTDGNDFLDGGPGNDRIFGLGGSDQITGGFGDDVVDGGAGIDTYLLARLRGDVEVTKNPDGSYTVEDLSFTSLGKDTLKGIERIVFADETLDLDPATPPPPPPPPGSDGKKANVRGTSQNDDMRASGDKDGSLLSGHGADDALRGGKYNDVLYGGAGDDILSGGGGSDQFRFIASQYEGDGGSDVDRIVDLNFSGGDWLVFEDFGDGTWRDAEGLSVFDSGTDAIVSSWTGLKNLINDAGNVTVSGSAVLDLLIVTIQTGSLNVQQIRIAGGYDDYLAVGGSI